MGNSVINPHGISAKKFFLTCGNQRSGASNLKAAQPDYFQRFQFQTTSHCGKMNKSKIFLTIIAKDFLTVIVQSTNEYIQRRNLGY